MTIALPQPVRFALVGAGGYLANLAVFAALYELGTAYVAASVTGYLVSNALMYLGNRYFTFGLGHDGFWSAYARYFAVGCVVSALTAILLVGLVEGAGIDPRLGQGLALVIVMPVAFLLVKRWSFQLVPA